MPLPRSDPRLGVGSAHRGLCVQGPEKAGQSGNAALIRHAGRDRGRDERPSWPGGSYCVAEDAAGSG